MSRVVNQKIIVIFLIILIGAFLRFFKLSEYPVQLNHDEVSQLYDVISISKTQSDIYGNFLPLAFPSTGDYKVGHYIYISTIFYWLFGNHEFTIRLASALFGTLTLIGVFLLIRKISGKFNLAALCSLIIALTPSEIFYSRKSFENVIGVSLDFFGLYFLIKGLEDSSRRIWILIAICILSLSMYIYTSQVIIVPILFLIVALLNWEKIKQQKKQLLKYILIWIILVTPLILITFTNNSIRFRASSVFVTQDSSMNKEVLISEIPIKTEIEFVFERYLTQFNLPFLFLNGLNLTNQKILNSGPLMAWQFPFTILGFYFLFKEQRFKKLAFLLTGIVLAGAIPSAITFEEYSPHRAMIFFTALSIVSATGLYWFLGLIMMNKSLLIRYLFSSIIFIMIFFSLVNFIRIYTVSFPFEKSQYIQYPYKEIAKFIWSEYGNFDHIIFDPKFGKIAPMVGVGVHYYLAYYGNYPVEKFQREYKATNEGIFFDKFAIRSVFWPKDRELKNTLVVVSSWSVPLDDLDNKLIIKKFSFYDGSPAYYAIKL